MGFELGFSGWEEPNPSLTLRTHDSKLQSRDHDVMTIVARLQQVQSFIAARKASVLENQEAENELHAPSFWPASDWRRL